MIEYLKYIAVGVCFVPFNWRLHAERRYDGSLLMIGLFRFALLPYLDLPTDDPRSADYKARQLSEPCRNERA